MSQLLLLSESQHSWSIVIHDGNSGARIFTHKSLTSVDIIDFDEKVFIWLPLLVINDLNSDLSLILGESTALELDDLIDSDVILRGGCFSIDSSHSDGLFFSVLVLNLDAKHSSALTDRVMETRETYIWISLSFVESIGHFIFSSDNGALFDSFLGVGDGDLFTVSNPLNQGNVSKFLLQLVDVNA